ncbi:MAG: methyltransferase dimerization domain-containing protein [bacterium]
MLAAVKLGVFTQLNGTGKTGEELGAQLGLHERGIADFFDALVSLGFLEREGEGSAARYRNTEEAALFLEKTAPSVAEHARGARRRL